MKSEAIPTQQDEEIIVLKLWVDVYVRRTKRSFSRIAVSDAGDGNSSVDVLAPEVRNGGSSVELRVHCTIRRYDDIGVCWLEKRQARCTR